MAATLWYCDVLGHQCNHVVITGQCFSDKHLEQTGVVWSTRQGTTGTLSSVTRWLCGTVVRAGPGRREYVLYSLLLRDTPSVLGVVECGAVTQSR